MKLLLTSFVAFMAVTFTSSAEINPEEHKSNKECKTIALEGDYYENGGEEEIEKPNEGSPCQGTESSQCPVQTQGHTECPEGEVMGWNLQCISRRRIQLTNYSVWQEYG
ncbi:uncharacterized protein LOC128683746 [Plodia interpunctella]|uniref:uncharacterized protein LOC128683746 n=1 Tax=Plodia interpunctella TaxID=58824 RepID=UPI002367DF8F|nr:uncharacterized protein LOC128683746 isoform X2 [Plodia interpunctella]